MGVGGTGFANAMAAWLDHQRQYDLALAQAKARDPEANDATSEARAMWQANSSVNACEGCGAPGQRHACRYCGRGQA